MPRRVHADPFILRPPDDLVAARPDLKHRAADLARAYRHMSRAFDGTARGGGNDGPDTVQVVSEAGLQQIGAALWAALVAADPTLPERLAGARAAAGTYILPLVVESGSAAVQRLPWETLHHPEFGFLGRDGRFALSRRLPSPFRPHPPDRGPLKVVMFTCLPDDVDPQRGRLDVEEQQEQALQALGAAVAEGRVTLEMPDDGRFSTLERLIRDVDPHVVFLFAHGKFRNEPGQTEPPYAIIQFEGDHGGSDLVRDERLAGLFAAGSGARAVVLAACESGMGDSAALAAGLAGALSRAGVPHVIGMRETILARAGIACNAAFAAAVTGDERVDVAAQLARAAITRPLAGIEGVDRATAELSLGQWPLPALLSHDPAAPLVDWNFTPRPPDRVLTSGSAGQVVLPSRFIGRRSELRDWKDPLLRGDKPVLLISGVGGQGKTALAGKIARDWETATGRAALVWSATAGAAGWDAFYLGLVERAGAADFQAATAGMSDETGRAAALLRLLLARAGGRLLLFLDNLETLQDDRTLDWTDGRVAAFVAAARDLAAARDPAGSGSGLRLLLTSRYRPPGWPAAAHLPLTPVSFGDFLQLALFGRAPAAFWHSDPGGAERPRRIYRTLNGNARGLGVVAGALAGLDPAAEAAFLNELAAAEEKVRVDIALAALIGHLDGEARALLDRLPAYDVAVPADGIRALALDLPGATAALDRLLAVGLVERYADHEWQALACRVAPLAAAWLAEQPGYALDPARLRAAAGYQQWLFEHERRTLGQAIVLHRALSRAGERAAADRLALDEILRPLNRAGLYRTLLKEWLPRLRESADDRTRSAGLGWSGNCHLTLGEYDLALPYFEQSLAIRRQIGDRAGEGATLNNISQIYDARGDYDTALTCLQQSLAIRRDIGDRAGEGTTLNNMATAALARGDYDTALDYLQQSLAIQRDIGDRAGEGTTLNNIATAALARGDYDTALTCLQQSLAICRQIGDRAGEGATLNNISQIYRARGDYDTALTFLQQSLAIRRQIGDRAGEGTTLNNMATAAHARGDYDTALTYLQQSLAIQRDIGDRAGEGATLNNISQIYDARGDYDTALTCLQQSLAIRRDIGDRAGEGTTLNNISQIYDARGDYDTALDYLQQSLAIQRDIGDRAGEGATLNNIATAALARGDYDTALTCLQQSLAICRQIGDRAGEGATLNNISQIYRARGDYDTALTFLQQSLAIRRQIGDASGLCATLFNMGHIHWQNGQQGEALGAWVAAYQLASRIGEAQALAALERLAGQLGLPGGLAGWAALAGRMGGGDGGG